MYRTKINKIGLFIASLSIIVAGVQCSLNNPVAPSWEADINVPLIKNNTYIGDFLGIKGNHKGDPVLPIILGATSITGGIKMADISAIRGMIVNGTISYDLENRLGIGLDTAIIYISRDSGTVYQAPEVTIGPLRVEAAETDSNGKVIQAKNTHIDIILGEKEMQILGNERGVVFVGYYLVTNGTNGQTVNILPTDYLKTSVMVSVRTKVN